jgi:phage-related minor tail protein
VQNFARRVWIIKDLLLRRLSCASSTGAVGPELAGVPPAVVVAARGTFSRSGSVSEPVAAGTGFGSEGWGFSLDGGVETGAWVFVVAAGASTLAG